MVQSKYEIREQCLLMGSYTKVKSWKDASFVTEVNE